MHRTTVWLTHDDTELLREFAFRERRTMSDVIREGTRLVVDPKMDDPWGDHKPTLPECG